MSEANRDRAAGLEHFQAAARELIAAFRSVLDVAEELIDDPDTVKDAVSAFGTMARTAARQAAGFASGSAERVDADVEHIDVD